MPLPFQQLRELLAADNIEQALDVLNGAHDLRPSYVDEVALHRGRLQRAKAAARRGLATPAEDEQSRTRLAYAILALVTQLEEESASAPTVAVGPSGSACDVFISYSHTESAVATRLRDFFRSQGLRVIIDADDLAPGGSIVDFIRRSVKAATATVVIVSAASLMSAWVMLEVVTSMTAEDLDVGTRLIACSTDQRFFEPEFRLQVTKEIDARLAVLDGLLREYGAKHLDITDIATEQVRLSRMRADLGGVLDRLRTTLTLRIDGDAFEGSASKIAKHLLPMGR